MITSNRSTRRRLWRQTPKAERVPWAQSLFAMEEARYYARPRMTAKLRQIHANLRHIGFFDRGSDKPR